MAAAVLTALVLMVGCDGCRDFEPPAGVEGAHQLAETIPADARIVLFSQNFGELTDRLNTTLGAIPAPLETVGDVDEWEQAGVWIDGPAAVFVTDSQFAVVAWADPEREIDLHAWPRIGDRAGVGHDVRGVTGWRETVDGKPDRWAGSDGARIAAGWTLEASHGELDRRIWKLQEQHWTISEQLMRLLPDDDDEDGDVAPLYGAVDAASLMGDLDGEGRAGDILEMMQQQVGTVYWRLDGDHRGTSRRFDLYTPGQPGVPSAIQNLGEAHESLPDLGGLVRPGTPGVIRLSMNPDTFVELLRSTMEVDQRQQLDMALEMLRTQLQLDLQRDLVGNLTGQAAVVLFGIEDAFFEARGLELIASMVRLETTREAVVVPIDDSDEVEHVFNIFTQLSQGSLRRDAGEHTIQYAWFDDGALEWAVLLTDDHLAFVDSMIALDRFRRWEQSPSPLDQVFVDRGVDEMLQGRRGMGVYLDTGTIRTILQEGGAEEQARWLRPIEALRLETDVGGTTELAQLELWLTGLAEDR